MTLPKQYAWLANEPGPRILLEFLKLYGTIETPGAKSNPLILSWAKDIGLGKVYNSDAIAWCGLTCAYAAAQAGWDYAPRGNALWARNWLAWGNPVKLGEEKLGDILVFSRGAVSGHVGMYIGQSKKNFFVLGGNQSDAVNIKPVARNRLLSGRRCPWRVSQPPNVRQIFLKDTGEVSKNEA